MFVGFGSQSQGGAGGTTIPVTNLRDSGPGSLRAAIDTPGARTLLFLVSGLIELQAKLSIKHDRITVPAEGKITIKTHESYGGEALEIRASDVIITGLHIRPGPSTEGSATLDALVIRDGERIVIDHCSLSWATDGVLDISGGNYITVQYCIIAEGLNFSTHQDEGAEPGVFEAHSGGMLIKGQNVTLYQNLFAHNNMRNPRIVTTGIVEVINNVIYNSGNTPGCQIAQDGARVNLVGNYQKAGPDTALGKGYYARSEQGVAQIFVEGNKTPWSNGDNKQGVIRESDWDQVVDTRHSIPAYAQIAAETDAASAYAQVLATAGAGGPIDERIKSDVRNGTGRIIDDPSEVGGWMAIEYKILYAKNVKNVDTNTKEEFNHLFMEVEFYRDGQAVHIESFEIGRPKFKVDVDPSIPDEDLSPGDFSIVPWPIADDIEKLINIWIRQHQDSLKLDAAKATADIDNRQKERTDDTDPQEFKSNIQHLIGVKRGTL